MIVFILLAAGAWFFPVLTGVLLVATASRRSWLGAGVLIGVALVAVTLGYDLVPDIAVMEGKGMKAADIDDTFTMLTVFLVFTPAGVAAWMHGNHRSTYMYGALGMAAAVALAVLFNAFCIFGHMRLWAWEAALVISAFMACGYGVRNYWGVAVVASAITIPFIAVGHSLPLAAVAVLFAFLVVAALLSWWCLPADTWDADVLKLAVATKWRDDMWTRIEPMVTTRLRIIRGDESLPFYTREDIEFVMVEFTNSSLKLRDMIEEVVLGFVNRRWDYETMATMWNKMIDERDPMLKPDSASFKSLRKLPV